MSLQHDAPLTNERKPVNLVTFYGKVYSAEYLKLISGGIRLRVLSKRSCSSRLACVTQGIELIGNSLEPFFMCALKSSYLKPEETRNYYKSSIFCE